MGLSETKKLSFSVFGYIVLVEDNLQQLEVDTLQTLYFSRVMASAVSLDEFVVSCQTLCINDVTVRAVNGFESTPRRRCNVEIHDLRR